MSVNWLFNRIPRRVVSPGAKAPFKPRLNSPGRVQEIFRVAQGRVSSAALRRRLAAFPVRFDHMEVFPI